MLSRQKVSALGSSFWGILGEWFVKIRKELTTPNKPTWVIIFMTAANLAVIMMVGWKMFFQFFDRNLVFLLGSQFSIFVVLTALSYKNKENKNKMNAMASVFIVILAIGFIFGHDGFRSWVKDETVARAASQPIQPRSEERIRDEKVVVLVGETTKWYFVPPGYRAYWDGDGRVYVDIVTTSGGEYSFEDSPEETIAVRRVAARKMRYTGLEDRPVHGVITYKKM